VGSLWPIPGFSFGEPRVIPDTSYYFDNIRFDRYPYATVAKVVSSDTIIVQVEGEKRMRLIRLAGIEGVPESAQPYNQQAMGLLNEMIQHQIVKLEGDKLPRNQDATELMEAYVWLNGQQINAVLVRNGLAGVVPYSHNIKYDNYFTGLQAAAQNEKLGVWSAQ
jgi:micrococcal nuclease